MARHHKVSRRLSLQSALLGNPNQMLKIYTSILGTAPGERETGASVVDIQFVHLAVTEGHLVTVVVSKGRDTGLVSGAQHHLLLTTAVGRGSWGRLAQVLRTAQRFVELYQVDRQVVFRVNSFLSSLLEVIPLLVYSRGRARLFIQFHHKDHSRLRNAIARQVLRRAQVIICPSDAARHEVIELLGQAPVGLHRVHHGVEEKFFLSRSTQQHAKLEPPPLRLLFVGHLEQRKNPSALLDVAAALYGCVQFELTIVGKGPELAALKFRCHDQPWASVVSFLGEVSDAEKLKQYAKADLFVFPSRQEGFGLVLCEAMAAGVPVLAFNTSAMPEIVQPGTGFLVDVNDLLAMVEIITRLARDRGQLEQMRAGAVQHARTHFRWEQKIAEICTLLDSAFPPITGRS